MVGAGIYAGLELGAWGGHKIPPDPEETIQSPRAGVEGMGWARKGWALLSVLRGDVKVLEC